MGVFLWPSFAGETLRVFEFSPALSGIPRERPAARAKFSSLRVLR